MRFKTVTKKYRKGSKVKHMFWTATDRYSICGQGIIWYNPEQWLTDEKGLKERQDCKTCIRVNRGDSSG